MLQYQLVNLAMKRAINTSSTVYGGGKQFETYLKYWKRSIKKRNDLHRKRHEKIV